MNKPTEATIIISGKKLTYQQSMTLRVAMNHFMSYLTTEGLGDDETGRRITSNYITHSHAILKYIHEEAN